MRMPTKTLLSLAVASTVALAPNAFARDHGRWGHHDRGWRGASYARHRDYDRYRSGHYRYYRHGHYDHFGRWVAGAIVATALVGLVADATAPRTVYYHDAPPSRVVYREPTVIYEDRPVVERRVYETRVYEAPPTRYIRDDGWDGDDGGR